MNKKVIFADLDGTLIKTVSGSRLPKGVWDMKIRYEVLDPKEITFDECDFYTLHRDGCIGF